MQQNTSQNIDNKIEFLNQLFSVVAFAIEPIAQVSIFPVIDKNKIVDFEFCFDWHRSLRCDPSSIRVENLSSIEHEKSSFEKAFNTNKALEPKIFPFLKEQITPILIEMKNDINQNNLLSQYDASIPIVCGLVMDPRLPSFEPQVDAIETSIVDMSNNDELSKTFEHFCDLLHDIDANNQRLPKEVLIHVDKGQSFHEQEFLTTLLDAQNTPLINKNSPVKAVGMGEAIVTSTTKKPKTL